MPNYSETIPGPKPNLQFPGGDIEDRYIEAANLLYCRMTIGDRYERMTKIRNLRIQETGLWRSRPSQDKVYAEMQYLADSWGHNCWPDDESGKSLAAVGMFATLGFINRSKLLPISNLRPFNDTILEMSTYSPDRIRFFGDEAWAGMHDTHPAVYSVLAPWVRHLAETFSVEDEEKQLLLGAACAMPYMMSVAAKMERYFSINTDRQISKITMQK